MTSLGQNGGESNVPTSVREEHGDARSFVTVYRGQEARSVVEGLDPGSYYGFRVLAMNKLGSGSHSGILQNYRIFQILYHFLSLVHF